MKRYKGLASASKSRRSHPEHDAQVQIFKWAAMMEHKWPELALIFAVPNGGRRSPRQGAWLKSEGLKSGVPDIWLPVASRARQGNLGTYHGLTIELKVGKGKPSPAQVSWLTALREQGWDARVCYGAEEAITFLTQYLGSK